MYSFFPTEFAMKIAYRLELIQAPSKLGISTLQKEMRSTDSGSTEEEIDVMISEYKTLEEFQELSLVNEFEDSMVAYHGVEISEEQRNALMLIHKSTPIYAYSNTANKLLSKIQDSDSFVLPGLIRSLIDLVSNEHVSARKNNDPKRNNQKRFIVSPIKSVKSA